MLVILTPPRPPAMTLSLASSLYPHHTVHSLFLCPPILIEYMHTHSHTHIHTYIHWQTDRQDRLDGLIHAHWFSLKAVTHTNTLKIFHTQVKPSLYFSSLSFHSYHPHLPPPPPPTPPTSLPLLLLALGPFLLAVFFFSLSFLFGLPRPLINPTNSKGYINVDNQFLYVSSQSLEKKILKKKKSKLFYSIVQMCFFLLFLMLLHLLI